MRLLYGVIAGLLLVASPAVRALTFHLSEQDVNQMVVLAFPQSRLYQGVNWTLSEPAVKLGENRGMKVSVTLTAVQAGKTLQAKGTFSGTLAYRAEQRQLQIEKPTLDAFDIVRNELADSQALVDILNGLQGQPLPMILLIDFSQANLGLLGNQLPRRIEIQQQKLLIEI